MEGFFEGLGVVVLVLLAVVGLAIGWAAGALSGRSKPLYAAIGAVAALATPLLLVAFGVTALAAGGVLLVAVVGAVGAAVVVAIVRGVSGKS